MRLVNNVDLVILCGGIGSRLGNLTKKIPKPLLEINKKPFIEYLIQKYQKYNFSNIFLLTAYKSKIFKKKYHNKYFNLTKCTVISEKFRKGTGGSLIELKNLINNNFLLINGDSFLDEDLDNFFELKKNKVCKMILVKNTNYQQNKKLSYLSINKNSDVIYSKIDKKKKMNAGIYFFSKKIFKYIKNEPSSLETDVLPKLISKNKVHGIISKNFFIDIGIIKNLNFAKKNYTNFTKQRALLLDRDGVINRDIGYLHKIKDISWISKIKNILKKISKDNFYRFIITNQSGIGRGFYNDDTFKIFQKKYNKFLAKDQIFFDDVVYCPHHPKYAKKKFRKKCSCRKPNNGMIENILRKWNLNRNYVGMIGDKKTDYMAAKKSKIKFIYADKSEREILNFIKKI